MPIWKLRKFTGLIIQSFAFTVFILNGYVFPLFDPDRYPVSHMGPDPSNGLIYICTPKNVPWYYGEETIVRSWYFSVLMVLIMIGGALQFRVPQTTRSEVNATNAIALCIGMITACAFLFVFEARLVRWIIVEGFGPPSLPCASWFVGF